MKPANLSFLSPAQSGIVLLFRVISILHLFVWLPGSSSSLHAYVLFFPTHVKTSSPLPLHRPASAPRLLECDSRLPARSPTRTGASDTHLLPRHTGDQTTTLISAQVGKTLTSSILDVVVELLSSVLNLINLFLSFT